MWWDNACSSISTVMQGYQVSKGTRGKVSSGKVRFKMVHHPSAMRNREPIAEKLQEILPQAVDKDASLQLLEIASGTGCHVEYFASKFPGITFQPSEYIPTDETADNGKIGKAQGLATIDKHGSQVHPNVLPAVAIDGSWEWERWPVQSKAGTFDATGENKLGDAMLMCNVTHISPWVVTLGVFRGASNALRSGGRFVLYGPFKYNGGFTTESNEDFDRSLKERNPLWGYRDIHSEIIPAAAAQGLRHDATFEMPANNYLLTFSKL